MHDSRGYINSVGNLFITMIKVKNNLYICITSLIICILNTLLCKHISTSPVKVFLTSYLKDFIGAIAFIACCNIILSFFKKEFYKLSYIIIFMLFCGLFWEFITPIYRENSVSDIYDIYAYILGGIMYWLTKKTIL